MTSICQPTRVAFLLLLCICTMYADDNTGRKTAKLIVSSTKDVRLVQSSAKDDELAVVPVMPCGGKECDLSKEWCDTAVGTGICTRCDQWCTEDSMELCRRNCKVYLAYESRKSPPTQKPTEVHASGKNLNSEEATDTPDRLPSCTWERKIILGLVVTIVILCVLLALSNIITLRVVYFAGENRARGGHLQANMLPQLMKGRIGKDKVPQQPLYDSLASRSVNTSTSDIAGNNDIEAGVATADEAVPMVVCQPEQLEILVHQPTPSVQDLTQRSRPQPEATRSLSDSTAVKEVDSRCPRTVMNRRMPAGTSNSHAYSGSDMGGLSLSNSLNNLSGLSSRDVILDSAQGSATDRLLPSGTITS